MALVQDNAQINVLDVAVLVLRAVQDVLVAQDALNHVLTSAEVVVILDALQVAAVLVLRAVQLDVLHVRRHVMDARELVPDAQQRVKVVQDALINVAPVVRTYVVEHVQQSVEMDVKLVAILVALRAARISVFPRVQEPV